MSETPEAPQNDGAQAAPDNMPVMRLMMQYLKDLSFESPGAPMQLATSLPQPQMEVTVDVNARGLGENRYEVELSVSATAKRDDQVAYVCEVNYAGLFHIENVPAERMEPLMLVDAPHLLFPFIRQIVAQSVRDGGFPPLLLEPLDFVGMYQQQRMAKAQQEAQGATLS